MSHPPARPPLMQLPWLERARRGELVIQLSLAKALAAKPDHLGLIPWSPHGGRREPTCPQTSACTPWRTCTPPPHTHTLSGSGVVVGRMMMTMTMISLIYKEKSKSLSRATAEAGQAQGNTDKLQGTKPAREKVQCQPPGSTRLPPHTEGT